MNHFTVPHKVEVIRAELRNIDRFGKVICDPAAKATP
jgi:hypothetical protein